MNPRDEAAPISLLLYDGVCGLCNRLVQFTLRHDRNDEFRFASLQSPTAERVLARHGAAAAELDTFYIVTNLDQPGERLLDRSEAAIFLFRKLGPGWRMAATIGQVLPRGIRDALYNLVARNRYRIFGKLDQCPVPAPGQRHKFLDC